MTYAIEILVAAKKQLSRIHPTDRDRIIAAIQELGADPRPDGCRKLTGREAWRIRIGDYRVIYEIHGGRLVVLVVAVGHRGSIYR